MKVAVIIRLSVDAHIGTGFETFEAIVLLFLVHSWHFFRVQFNFITNEVAMLLLSIMLTFACK